MSLNRKQRRAGQRDACEAIPLPAIRTTAAKRRVSPAGLVPVVSALDGEFLEWADAPRVRILMDAHNLGKVIREHRDQHIVAIQLLSVSDDGTLAAKHGNPRRYSHNHEVDEPDWTGNPNNVWTLKQILRKDRHAFRAVQMSCAA